MRRFPLLLAVVVAIASGCSLRGDDNANGGLANTSWTVQSIAGAATVGALRPTMTFAPGGTLTGSAGCNQYSTTFHTDGSTIAIGQIASTLMMCDGNIGAQEAAFLSALQGATSWRQAEDGNLVLSGAGEIVAGPGVVEGPPDDAPVMELGGTAWHLVDMAGTGDFVGFVPTLFFSEDGTVALFAGCNKFSGSFTQAGTDLRFGPLGGTKIGCEPPASAIEATYLAALARVTSWSIGPDGRLTLGGGMPLMFEPD